MPDTVRLPSADQIAEVVSMLVGSDVEVAKRSKGDLNLDDCAIATYSDPEGNIQRLIFVDLAFANYSGAALTRIPAASSNEAVAAGEISGSVLDNFKEIMNIAVNMFSDSFHVRLTLQEVLLPNEPREKLANFQPNLCDSVEFDIEIPNYGVGRLGFLAN